MTFVEFGFDFVSFGFAAFKAHIVLAIKLST